MRTAAFAFPALLVLLQISTVTKMSDRALDGLKGPAKHVFEESSPLSNGSSVAGDARCRRGTWIYDPQGRLTSKSDYPGIHCEEEIKEDYTYDKDGNRHEVHDASRASGISLGPGPPTARRDFVHKRTFDSDQEGRKIVSDYTYSSVGTLVDLSIHVYDTQNRLLESRSLDMQKRVTGRKTFSYLDNARFPTGSTSFGQDAKPYSRATYADYELNAQGDWIKRTEITERQGGSKSKRFLYRTIDYY